MGRMVGFVLLAALAISRAPVDSAENGQKVALTPAFEVFPGTQYDTPLTHSYEDAHGSAVVPNGGGNSPACSLVANGLLADTIYTVHVDATGSTAGNVSTAGPWVQVGQFETNGGGHGSFEFASALPSGAAIYINQASVDKTVLISGNLP
jgi:hypothetical protein